MIYDSIDMAFDLDGDFVISEQNDIMTTEFDVLVGIIQAIQLRVKYPAGSWNLYPDLGVLETPEGQINSEETADAWENLIITSLVSQGLVDSSDIELTSAPLNEETIVTLIQLSVDATEFNGQADSINIYAVMDYGQKIFRFY
tara:strand:- start:277 stop:705 length:429 start_codon:yes stop_codon:yes gene_type:complete